VTTVPDDRTLRAIPRVAEFIAKADALLITAGAGMSVDSGLPDFRGEDGFWRAYPALGKLGISFEEMAQPSWFIEAPEMAWAFYGHRQQLYRATEPHAGYRRLLEWGRAMPAGYFVVTSNVDGQFGAVGFPGDRVLEQHGNIHRYQCTRPCSDFTWIDDPPDLDIDLETITARGTLPRCPQCGAMARPNVLMFGDADWVPKVTREQERRYRSWLASVRGRRLVVLEFGAGTAIATIRRLGERLAAERDRTTLVRINPDATDADEPVIPVRLGALEALMRIEEKLPAQFRGRCGVPAARSAQVASAAEDLRVLKMRKVYSRAWSIRLGSGESVYVDRIDVERNYLGYIDGLPGRGNDLQAIERARAFAKQTFHGPEPVVIPPVLFDPNGDEPILPPLRFVAQISSYESINAQDDGSWMNLIWFAEIDDEKSLKAFVEEALAQVDWKRQATAFVY
jgi:NAD-dependent SIR2 family protein deacetylase